MPKARKRKPTRPHGPTPTATRKRQVRPIGNKFPPKVDLGDMTFEEAMHKMLNRGPVDTSQAPTEWRCIDCGRQVWYPEVYYRDNRCEQCHEQAQG